MSTFEHSMKLKQNNSDKKEKLKISPKDPEKEIKNSNSNQRLSINNLSEKDKIDQNNDTLYPHAKKENTEKNLSIEHRPKRKNSVDRRNSLHPFIPKKGPNELNSSTSLQVPEIGSDQFFYNQEFFDETRKSNEINLKNLNVFTVKSSYNQNHPSGIPCINPGINTNYLAVDNDTETLSGSSTRMSSNRSEIASSNGYNDSDLIINTKSVTKTANTNNRLPRLLPIVSKQDSIEKQSKQKVRQNKPSIKLNDDSGSIEPNRTKKSNQTYEEFRNSSEADFKRPFYLKSTENLLNGISRSNFQFDENIDNDDSHVVITKKRNSISQNKS